MRADTRAWAEVDLAAIRRNIGIVANHVGNEIGIMAIVKADAYGHGLIPTATAAVQAGCRWLGVAAVQEGVLLREAGIGNDTSIAVLAATPPGEAQEIVAYGLTALVGDFTLATSLAEASNRLGRAVSAHLDIESGMGRSGVLPYDAANLWNYARDLGIEFDGVTTHYSDADNCDPSHTRLQQQQFLAARESLNSAGAKFKWIHLDNSASTLSYRNAPCNLVRPGLLVYGICPFARENADNSFRLPIALTPALKLKARVATVRKLPAGHAVSYGATHILDRPSTLATITVGYGDGYPRALSNVGSMLIHGLAAPIVGRVCMDQTVVDVTDIPGVQPDDVAVCIGESTDCFDQDTTSDTSFDPANRIGVAEIAELIGQTQHVITTCLSTRIPRIYLDLEHS